MKDIEVFYTWRTRDLSTQHITVGSKLLCKRPSKKFNTSSTGPSSSRKICKTCTKALEKKRGTQQPISLARAKEKGKKKDFLRTREWKVARYKALKKNNGCCELCGVSKHDGAVLNVDHIKPRKTHPELSLSQSNLQVLCGSCNMGKGNWDETDWREPSLAKLMGEEL